MTSAESADVVIIGAGVIGLALARDLALRGVDTILVDRAGAGERATSAVGAAAGMVNPQAHDGLEPEPLRDLGLLSRHLYRDWIESIEAAAGVTCEYDVRGGLVVARNDAEEVALDRALDWQRARGLGFDMLSSEEALAREPSLTPEVTAAFAFPLEAQVSPPKLARALALAARAAGVRLVERAPVTGVLVEGGRACGVETPAARFLAEAVVNAAGAWGGHLAGAPRLPIEPVRGQLVSVDASADPERLRRFVYGAGVYAVPRRDGSIVIGSTLERVGFDSRPTAGGVAGLLARAAGLVPSIEGYALLDAWAGLRPASPDGIPILGETALTGYFVSVGHYKNGILLAPASAVLLADALTGQSPPIPLAPFSPARFDI